MKKLLTVLLISTSLLTVGCGREKVEGDTALTKEYSTISELFEDKGYLMKTWTPKDCEVLVNLYNEGQVLNSKEITNFVYDYDNFSEDCKVVVEDVYDSEKQKEDERIIKFKEEDSKKTEEFNAQYSNIKYTEAENYNEAIEEAKNLVTSQISNNLDIKDKFKIIEASYNEMTIDVFDLDFTNGGAVAVQNIIFDAYQEVGLSRGTKVEI